MNDQYPTTFSVQDAVQHLRVGRMVLICDDVERENEADLCLPAQFATPDAINFLLHQACGLICVALAGERLDTLAIPQEAQHGHPLQGTAFSSSVDLRHHTSTGISASDRALTIRALVDPLSKPEDFARPGHVFPLRARPGGTLERRGHTEAAVDCMRIAGLEPGAVICEVLDETGEPARGQALYRLARQWDIGMITVEDIVQYRRAQTIHLQARTVLPLAGATFTISDYLEAATGEHYLALTLGEWDHMLSPPLLRLHSACTTGDIFGSQRCDCQAQLQAALEAITAEGRGILLYLPQEGRGIGLTAKLQAYALQDQGHDTIDANLELGYPADARIYNTAVDILHLLGLSSARLLTNNPHKLQALRDAGITVERVPLEISANSHNMAYLDTKLRRLGHWLTPKLANEREIHGKTETTSINTVTPA